MYKTRLSRWNIFKYCRRTDDSRGRNAATGGGNGSRAAAPHKRPRTVQNASGKGCTRTVSTAAAARQSHTGGRATATTVMHGLLRAPNDLRFPEECISIVDQYAQGAVEQQLWTLDGAGLLSPGPKLSTWNNLTDVTLTLLLPRRPEFAFRVLRVCFDQYAELMRLEQKGGEEGRGDTHWLFLSTYAFVLRTATEWPDLARCFLRYCRDLARIVYPAGHPYLRLLEAMCRMGPSRMEACAADLLDACILAIERRFGPDSHCMAYALVYITNMCVFGRSLSPNAAGSKLRALLARLESRGGDKGHMTSGRSRSVRTNSTTTTTSSSSSDVDSTSTTIYDSDNEEGPIMRDFVAGLRLSLMRAHYRAGDMEAARQIGAGLPEVGVGHDGKEAGLWSWAYGPEIMRLAYETPQPGMRELLRVGQLWGAVVKQRSGIAGPWASAPLVEFRTYLDQFAGEHEVEIVRQNLESGMQALCQLACDDLVGGRAPGV